MNRINDKQLDDKVSEVKTTRKKKKKERVVERGRHLFDTDQFERYRDDSI